jgi:hypothetical protein
MFKGPLYSFTTPHNLFKGLKSLSILHFFVTNCDGTSELQENEARSVTRISGMNGVLPLRQPAKKAQ